MHEVEGLSEHLRVSSLAAALDAHDDVFPHVITFARNRAAASEPVEPGTGYRGGRPRCQQARASSRWRWNIAPTCRGWTGLPWRHRQVAGGPIGRARRLASAVHLG